MTAPYPGASTFTLTFGPYTDARGAVQFAGMTGRLTPVDPTSGRPVNLVHVPSGQVLIPVPLTITLAGDSTATLGPIPHTDDSALSPQGWAYKMEWDASSQGPNPGSRTFYAPLSAGSTVDYDLTVASSPIAPLNAPSVTSVAGFTGAVTGTQIAADPAVRAAYVAVFTPEKYGAKADGTTDDTAAIQAALDAAAASTATSKVVYLNGVYKVNTATSAAGLSWCLSLTADNVTLLGRSGAIIRNTTASAVTIFIGGCGKPEGHSQWLKYVPWRYAGDTYASGTAITPASTRTLLPMAAASRGALSVTLTTASDAGTLAAGDVVVVRSGQVTNDAGNWNAEPVSEYNTVKSVNATTGVVTFERPLAKDYVQEYQSAIGQTSSTTVAAVTVPMAIAKVTAATQRNVTIQGLRFESPTSTVAPILIRGVVDGLVERDVQFDCAGMAHDAQEYRDALFQGIHAVMRGSSGVSTTDRWPITVATGCSDVIIEDLTAVATDVTAVLHIHEASARVRARRVTLMSGPSATTSSEISVRSRAFDVDVDDYTIIGGGAANAVFIGSDCDGGGNIGRGLVRKPSMSARTVLCQAKNWAIAPPSDGRGGDIQIDPAVMSAGVSFPMRVLSGWVSHNQTTTVLGILPADSIIMSAGVHVYTAFDSSGTDVVNIGSPGSPTDTVSGIDVSAPFNKTVPVGAAMGFRDSGTTLQASYVAGGSAPTVGRALAWVVIATAPAQPSS